MEEQPWDNYMFQGEQQQAQPQHSGPQSGFTVDPQNFMQQMMFGFQQMVQGLVQANQSSTHAMTQTLADAITNIPARAAPPVVPGPASNSTSPVSSTVTVNSEPRVPDVDQYRDKAAHLPAWIDHCRNFFAQQPSRFVNDEQKIRYIISRFAFDSRAFKWANTNLHHALVKPTYLVTCNLEDFTKDLFKQQGVTVNFANAKEKILDLKQTHSVANYHTTFVTLAAQAGYTDETMLRAIFYHGLKDIIKRHMVLKPEEEREALSFASFANWAIEIDNQLQSMQRQSGTTSLYPQPLHDPSAMQIDAVNTQFDQAYRGRGGFRGRGRGRGQARITNPPPPSTSPFPSTSTTPVTNPSVTQQVSQSSISQEEWDRRRNDRACYLCARSGHFARDCCQGKA